MKKITFLFLIIVIIPSLKLHSQKILNVNICYENDWRSVYEMTSINDSVYKIDVDINKNKDIDGNFIVGTKFKILYDNGYKWIGGSFPSDTTGDMDSPIPVPFGCYSININVHTFKYQFINPDKDFYKFSNTDLDSNKVIYCQIVGTSRQFGTKVTIEIDFGQYKPKGRGSKLVDDITGQPILFNSMIDALNYMGKFGWEFVQAYTITTGNSNVYHYLLKKSNK